MDLFSIIILSLFHRRVLGRLFLYLFGAVMALGPTSLTLAKIIYLVFMFYSSFLALIEIKKAGLKVQYRKSVGLLPILIIFFALYLTTVAIFLGNSPLYIFRNIIFLILLLLSLPIIFQAKSHLKDQTFDLVIVSIGNFSAISVFFVWSQRHGLTNFGAERFALDADWLAFIGFITAITMIMSSNSKSIRIYLGFSIVLIPLFLILSLSRTNAVVVASIILVSFFYKTRTWITNLFRLPTLALFLISLILVSNVLNIEVISRRLIGTWNLFNLGGISEFGLGADLSIQLRNMQSTVAKNAFLNSPIYGSGVLPANQSFDTLWGSAMQFGIIGSFLLIVLIFNLIYKFKLNFHKNSQFLISFMTAILITSFIYNWPSNKSFWLALSLFFAKSIKISKYH